jgi:hypothetical protein
MMKFRKTSLIYLAVKELPKLRLGPLNEPAPRRPPPTAQSERQKRRRKEKKKKEEEQKRRRC